MTIPTNAPLELFDPRRGDVSFKLTRVTGPQMFAAAQRFNYFTVIFVQQGGGTYQAENTGGVFAAPALLFFNPYQTFFLRSGSALRAVALQFHANFFCIETHHQAVGCNGVLFNDIYGRPVVGLTPDQASDCENLLAQMERELHAGGLAQGEALVSLLKMLLIRATRLKMEQGKLPLDALPSDRPEILGRLIELIENQFRTMHSPADYAAALHITPKALGKLVKAHLGRTITELIRERLLKHAKWQLLHTRRPVKEIAWEVGFADEFYFSRLFKTATGLAPTAYREFETVIRGGSNLSM